jgi:hypothetical protein
MACAAVSIAFDRQWIVQICWNASEDCSHLRIAFKLHAGSCIDLAKMTAGHVAFFESSRIVDFQGAVKHLVQAVHTFKTWPGMARWRVLSQQLSDLQHNMLASHGNKAKMAMHAAKVSALQCANLTALWSVLERLTSHEGSQPSKVRGDLQPPSTGSPLPPVMEKRLLSSLDARLDSAETSCDEVKSEAVSAALHKEGAARNVSTLGDARTEESLREWEHGNSADAGSSSCDTGAEHLAYAVHQSESSCTELQGDEQAPAEPREPEKHSVGIGLPRPWSEEPAPQVSTAHMQLGPQHKNMLPVTQAAEAGLEEDAVAMEIVELYSLLSAFQVLPEAAREEAAAIAGYGTCTKMLRRLFELKVSWTDVDRSMHVYKQPTLEEAQLVELIFDDGLSTLLRFSNGLEMPLQMSVQAATVIASLQLLKEMETDSEQLGPLPLLRKDVQQRVPRNGQDTTVTGERIRSGIPGTLHRIAVIRGMDNSVVGLTLRIGRQRRGFVWPLADVMQLIQTEMTTPRLHLEAATSRLAELSPSVLLLGGPGAGKTTALREIANELSDHFSFGRQCIVVDASSEIGGFGRVCISAPSCQLPMSS